MSFNDDYLKLRKKRLEEQQKQQKNAPFVFESGPYQNATLTADDIAPVATNTIVIDDVDDVGNKNAGNESGLFKAGTFSNGYQFGDVTKAILGTAGDAVTGIVQGVAGIGEGLGDLISYGIAGVQDLVGNDDDAERLRKEAAKSQLGPLFDSLRENTNMDDTSLLGDFGYGIAQGVGQVGAIIATGGVGKAAGLGSVGTSALTTGMIGASSMGSGMSEAYQGGATDEEALTYGVSKGVIDAGTEMIFGGLGKSVKAIGVSKGLTSIDDVFAKKLSSKMSNQFFKNATEYGVKATAEGLEEVAAGYLSAVSKNLTYMSEEELSQLVEDENLLEQFAAGALVSGIAQSGDLVKSTKQGRDYITNFSGNEETVIEKVYNDRVAEAEQDGTKLTNKEKNKLYEQVQEDMRKGYISTDDIESVLGGETYKTYKDTIDSEDAILKEFDELGKKQNATLAEQARYAELQEKVKEIKSNSNRNNLKSQLSEEVYNSVKEKDFYLAESYNEKARRGTAFEADLSQYDDKTAETVKRAIDSGILNNTRRTHEFVDMVAKISADKGVLFDFTNNEKLKESGFAVDGASINGYVTKDGITVNISSAKATNSIVGHEISHVLEGTELYAEMQSALFEYAKSKNDYDSRRKALEELYKNVEGADIDAELTADLVGDYLFTDADFINNLSTKHRNVFQKIYDEIKYLLKIATKGSKEARQLEKVKRAFDKAYRANGKVSGDTKYSLSDSDGKQLTKEQSEYFKDSKMRDENGNLKVMYHGSQDAGFHVFDANMSDDDTSFFFVDSNDVAASYSGTSETYEAQTIRTAEDMNNFIESIGVEGYEVVEKDGKFTLLYEGDRIADSNTAKGIYEEFCWYEGVGEGDANYKVYLNLTNPLEVDAEGRNWNNISREFSQEVYGRYKSLTAEEKAALSNLAEWGEYSIFRDEMLEARATAEQGGSGVFDEAYTKNLARAYEKLGGANANLYDAFSIAQENFSEESLKEFAVKQMNTRDYARKAKAEGYDGVIFKNIVDNGGYSNGSEGASTVAIAFESNQIKSVANEKPTGNADIRYSLSSDSEGRELSAEQREYFKDSKIVDDNGKLKVMHHGSPETFTVFDKKKARSSGTYGKGFYFTDSTSHAATYGKAYDVYLNITNPLQNGTNDITKDQIRKFVEAIAEDEDYGIDNYGYDATIDSVTNSVYGKSDFGMIMDLNISCVGNMVEAIELFNKVNGTNYDGIVAPTETVAFYPEQIKSIDNKAPTSNPDIRFSLSEAAEETKDLIAVHNLTEEKLAKSLALGGLPMPSIAIARAKDGHSNFGNISLVFNKETIDPKFMRSNKVYSGDAWTPTYPRVEYKLNDKALKQIRDKISSLVSYDVLTDVGNAHLDSDNMTDTLNRFGGNVAEAFKNDDGLKYAYLKDTGANITLPMKEKNLSYYGYRENGAIIRVAEALSAEELQQALNRGAEAQEKIEPIVRSAVAEYMQEKYGNDPKLLELMMPKEKLTFSDLNGYIMEARNYHRNGVQQTVDTKAARELIREQVNQAEYENWLKNLFSDIVEKEGIRNDKDLFTPSGNRRSFEALHYEHNLENVIKAMKEKGDKGIGAWGGGNIFGAATTEYGSISEIKSEAQNRMKLMSESEYEEIRKGFSDRFFELAHSLPIHKDSFVATDDAANMLIEAVAKYKTKSGMANYLQNESKGWANYSDYVVEDLIQLVSEIRSMPVGYFEAKPQRAVGFNEVAAAIIPDSTNAEIKQILTDKGIPFIEYESGNEQARLEALNSLEEAKFSLSKEGETPKRHGNYNVFGEDIRLEAPTQEEVAPIQEDVAPESEVVAKNAIPTEDVAPMPSEPTIYELEQKQAELEDIIRKAMESNDPNAPKLIDEYGELLDTIAKRKKEESAIERERLASLDDMEAPPEMEAPYYGESEETAPENPFEDRDIKAVGNRKVKAYMYENPEVKPFFQKEANILLGELREGTKGERFYTEVEGGVPGTYGSDSYGIWSGTKRHVSADIEYLLDTLHFSYDDIEKGLNAIIEDNGKENNAASKRIEFILNDRLLKGYNDFRFGDDIPPNQDYINLLNEKQISEYSEEARANFFEEADKYAPPMEDIAPVAENTTVNEPKIEKPIEDAPIAESAKKTEIPPTFDTAKKSQIEGQQTIFKEPATSTKEEPIKTIKDRLEHKLHASYGELSHNKRLRREALEDFDNQIEALQKEYDSKKNKTTKVANDILRRIERLKRIRAQVDADWTKRINDNRANVEKYKAKFEEGFDEATGREMRSYIHAKKVDDIKAKFTEKGLDLDETLKNAKNLSTFATVDNTPQRVMEKSLGYKAGQILADETVNKVAQNESEGIKWLNSFTDRRNGVLAKLSKKYNIKPGSKESAAAQMYAEGFYVDDNNDIIKYGDAELAQDFPDKTVQKNIKGLANDPLIRQIYDETLKAINESRARNAYPEIQKLDNYFLHFRAMDDTFSRLGLPFNPNDIRAKDLPTDLNGVTADLKPGQPYFASAKHRIGKRTSFDLLGGLERYLTSAKNQIYHIDDIQTFRALRNYVADTYGQANGLEGLDSLTEEEAQERIKQVYGSHLSTFAKFLNEEANILAGKTALIDRGIEGVIGRRGITFIDTINKQVGANMVGLNVSSSLTNFIAGVQAIAKTNKLSCIKSFAQTTSSKISSLFGNTDSFVENNPTIIRRKGAERFYRTPFQKVGDAGYVLMSAVDNVTTEFIVRAKYDEFIKQGMSEKQAITEADKWTSRLMGDRSLGQMPHLYNSKMLGLVTKFQLEVRNQLDSQFYDTIQEAKVSNEDIKNGLARNAKTAAKVTATLFELAILQHLFGKAFESVAGYNPAFDIIDVLIKTFGLDDDEEDEDTVLDNVEEGFLALLEDLPYTSTLTGGRIPISSALPITELIKGEDEYGNEKSRLETLGEIAPYYILPTGYGQYKKTKQGLSMFDDDLPISGSYTDKGDLRFPIEDTPENRIQAGVFGQWASENARDYFDNERAPLKEKQIQEFIDSDMPIRDYWDYREGLSEHSKLSEKADYIMSLDLPISTKNLLINNIANREDDIDLTDYDEYGNFEEFDFATNSRELYDFLEDNNISFEAYMSSNEETKKAYGWAAKNPEKFTVSKAVASDVVTYRKYASDLYDIKADKDEDGKSISGSRKEKVIDYVNSLDIDYGARLILFKSEYNADDTYNYDIIDYLNNRQDISYEDMETILKELGFTVLSDGTIQWD